MAVGYDRVALSWIEMPWPHTSALCTENIRLPWRKHTLLLCLHVEAALRRGRI